MSRPPWPEYFMLLAKMVALRSGCNSRPSGAVIVKDRRILATGYNGPMPGAWHCTDRGPGYCFRREKGIPDIDKYNFCRATHAEANAIAQAARFGISVEGAELYCTLAPCYVCLKLIASAGIKAVYYEYDYESRDFERDRFWKEAIAEAGLVEFRQVRVSEETLRALSEILPYPTSRRRLKPTEFLTVFENGGRYRIPHPEALLNQLRYQARLSPCLEEVTFELEHPGDFEADFSGEVIFPHPGESLPVTVGGYSGTFSLSPEGRLELLFDRMDLSGLRKVLGLAVSLAREMEKPPEPFLALHLKALDLGEE